MKLIFANNLHVLSDGCAHLLTILCSTLCSLRYGLCQIASPNNLLFRLWISTVVIVTILSLLVDWLIVGGRGCYHYYCIHSMRPNTGPVGTPRESLITYKEAKLVRIKTHFFFKRNIVLGIQIIRLTTRINYLSLMTWWEKLPKKLGKKKRKESEAELITADKNTCSEPFRCLTISIRTFLSDRDFSPPDRKAGMWHHSKLAPIPLEASFERWNHEAWPLAEKSNALECHGTEETAEDSQRHKHLSNVSEGGMQGKDWGNLSKVSVANSEWKDTSENNH